MRNITPIHVASYLKHEEYYLIHVARYLMHKDYYLIHVASYTVIQYYLRPNT